MANIEIDSFVRKFKTLCQLGRSANLTLSSNAGKASLHLRVDLGVLSQESPPPPKQTRNGPARLRRREKRAAARKANAEEAEATLTAEEREVLEWAEKAKTKAVAEKAIVPVEESTDVEPKKTEQVEKETQTSAVEVTDELCKDSEYGSKSPNDSNKEEPKSVEAASHQKPPPIRDRALGGIDKYTVTYDDPTDDEYKEYFFACYILFTINNLFF